ncbi:hypothetical protein AWR27_21015 [Spirosoma montaniterrae]|uniref:HipA-like kinase domain-containing protein n=1 Tax=Spirosoma montaniterrae TaxID=1178516 RepID=A0A1P9X1R0_9BACT|nr:hypothetical protein AWR27_21015 [Spirosoma montaniterrae]
MLVSCSDLNDYVCKYRYPSRLFNELLAWCFLKEWNIPVPEACFISVRSEHITAEAMQAGGRLAYFERPVIGSLYYQHGREIDNSLTALGNNSNDLRKIQNRVDLLKIALFDLWMTNEDRNGNNYNLLLIPIKSGKFYLHAIDHASCFNSGNVGQYSLSGLTAEDSVLSTDICRLLYANSTVKKRDSEIVLELFRQNVAACKKRLPKFLKFVPLSWGINTTECESWLIDNLFADDWLKSVESDFRHYLQEYVC